MYHLEAREEATKSQKEMNQDRQPSHVRDAQLTINDDSAHIVCTVTGSLSIFKLTDRYGTAIAKLFPSIISAQIWSVRAWIVRKSLDLGKKIYEFEISDKISPLLLREPIREPMNDNKLRKELMTGGTGTASNTDYDSKVEEDFARRFNQSGTGWILTREPDPIILSNGGALIPDFVFEKYGRKLYFEIVGFWTREYLEKKLNKMADVLDTQISNRIELLVAVNMDNYANPSNSSSNKSKTPVSQLYNFIQKNHLITYKNESIPLRPILEHLNAIEQTFKQDLASRYSNTLLRELDEIIESSELRGRTIISVEDIAKKYNIPLDSALSIIKSREVLHGEKVDENHVEVQSIGFILVGKHLILNSKVKELKAIMEGLTKLNEAVGLFHKNGIPEESHLDLVSKLGFNIIWKGIDYNAASIEKKS
jgi:hypothetical protein